MNRNLTNSIRFVLDEFLPPVIRDSRFFMYPLFFIWYKGKNVSKLMRFKERAGKMTDREYAGYYEMYDAIANRETDLNRESIQFILDQSAENRHDRIIDVGCGKGFLLKLLKENGYTDISGCDIIREMKDDSIPFTEGKIEQLPFPDKSFDVVICNHTIEHITDSRKAIAELKRIARKKIIITTPRQKYYRYTFDLHVNFFPQQSDLLHLISMPGTCVNSNGDWSFAGNVQ
ncbi:MAG TPA: class I SAM-dependent methyltransferase [Bacteroidia bacterium]|nr:class I SAM-dependent methyltransferase [Bacteroidia bacterium]